MFSNYHSFEDWMKDKQDKVFLIWIYKKFFTPYEQDNKFIDESLFVDTKGTAVIIREKIDLPDGGILLGVQDVTDRYFDEIPQPGDENYYVEYVRLDEIRLAYSERENKDEE